MEWTFKVEVKRIIFSHQVHWGHPWKFLSIIISSLNYFKVQEKLHQEELFFFKVKDSKFQRKLAEEVSYQSKTNLFSTYTF